MIPAVGDEAGLFPFEFETRRILPGVGRRQMLELLEFVRAAEGILLRPFQNGGATATNRASAAQPDIPPTRTSAAATTGRTILHE